MRVKVIYSKRWNADQDGWDITARLFGYDSDIRRVQLLYPHLRNQALAGLANVKADDLTEYGLMTRAGTGRQQAGLYRGLSPRHL